MPPEQAKGRSVDQRADVYALGALLYHVLVGAPPYTGETSADVIEQVKTRPCTPVHEREPGAPADLVAIVTKAMARELDDRYGDAAELAQDLKRFETGQLVAAHHYTAPQLFWRWLRRFRVPVAIAAAAIVALAVFAVIMVSSIVAARRDAERRRVILLEERGRGGLLGGHAGPAAAYLIEAAAADGVVGGARGFLVAEALRPFAANLAALHASDRSGKVVVAYSPDDSRIATAGGDEIKIWRADGTLETRMTVPRGRTRVIAFDPGGHRLLAAGDDGIVRIWRLADGELQTFTGHTAAIVDAAWSPDGAHVVTASADGTVRAWLGAAASATCRREVDETIPEPLRPMVSVRFSPAGSYVAMGNENGTACIWDLSPTQPTHLRGHTGMVNSVRWSPDGKYVLTASADGTARLWDAIRRESPDGAYIAGKPVIAALKHDPGARVESAEFSPDGRLVLTAGTDKVAKIFELPDEIPDDAPATTAREIQRLQGADELANAIFSDDGELIATAARDGRATVWDAG